MTVFTLFIRTIFTLWLLLLISRILGRKTLSELTFYDFVIGLILGNIGGAVITSTEYSMQNGFISLSICTLWVLAIHMISLKSVKARKLIDAEPIMVLYKGKILENNLKKRYYNINDLLEMLREQGIFKPDQVEAALIESDGQLSVLKKPEYQALTSKNMHLQQNQLPNSNLAAKEIIVDGKIIEKNLALAGLTIKDLEASLAGLGIFDMQEVTLASITPDGKLYIDKQNDGIIGQK